MLILYLSLKMMYLISLYISKVELYHYILGFRISCTYTIMHWGIVIDEYGVSICIYFSQITFSSKETDVRSLFTEEQDQLPFILYMDANWNRNGSSSLLVQFISPLKRL